MNITIRKALKAVFGEVRWIFLPILFSFLLSCTGMASLKEGEGGEGGPGSSEEVLGEDDTPEFDGGAYAYSMDGVFLRESLPQAAVPPGIGVITGESGDSASALGAAEKAKIAASFREAYMEALFRGLPLKGVLGGDFVHDWPPRFPLTRVQNWRSAEPRPNSWGVPELVLAVWSPAHGTVFAVEGALLDAYGRSAGINGANGAAGYGSPRGNSFMIGEDRAQRFDLGLIRVDARGRMSFISEDAPSAALEPSSMTGAFPDGGSEESRIREAFVSAWKMGIDRDIPPMNPDGPVRSVHFDEEPYIIQDGGLLFRIETLYYQWFGSGQAVYVLADFGDTASDLPFRARVITGSFLSALLLYPSPVLLGSESLGEDFSYRKLGARDGHSRALLRGIAYYGFPLSDPFLRDDMSAMRFSKGWMIIPPPQDPQAAEGDEDTLETAELTP
ncbi:hypothetical protein LJC14_03200 [Treponema sp. OttesenSCG-928-L16]|nr:hypothetical protein [Treponema sp. OttesenSCG-928-L16]